MKDIAQLARDLAEGRTTSEALVKQALARIEAHREAGGVAYISVDARSALLAARASDLARSSGYVPSALAGLPVSIKDLFDVAGQITASGSSLLAEAPAASRDAVVVERLRAAGAIVLGRTNMSEFAFSGLGLNPHYGTPLTPCAEQRIAGGSSSGAAVSVALEMAVAGLGTDTGGSIRIPAAFCNLTGFKPSASRVPLTGTFPPGAEPGFHWRSDPQCRRQHPAGPDSLGGATRYPHAVPGRSAPGGDPGFCPRSAG